MHYAIDQWHKKKKKKNMINVLNEDLWSIIVAFNYIFSVFIVLLV